MRAKSKNVWVALLCSLIVPVLCIGCGWNSEQKRQNKAIAYRDKVNYDYEKVVASPEQEVLFQNEDKTIVYKVAYQPDMTAKEAAQKYENDTKGASKERTVWEQAMWEYNLFCYENKYAWRQDDTYFHSVDYGIEVWKYVVEDKAEKLVTEVLFFDRADGAYSIEMTYPTKDVNAKMMVYYFITQQDFQVDIDRLAKIQEGIEWKNEVNEKGELVVTVTNHGDETVEYLSCFIQTDLPPKQMEDGTTQEGAAYSYMKENVSSGQTVTFSLAAEQMEDVIDYRVDVSCNYKGYMMDLEKHIWYLQ